MTQRGWTFLGVIAVLLIVLAASAVRSAADLGLYVGVGILLVAAGALIWNRTRR